MCNSNEKEVSKKGFFAKLFDRLDKKLEEKSKKNKCCCENKENNDKGNKC